MREEKSEFKLDLSFLICNTQILITSLLLFGLLWGRNEVSKEVVCRLPQSTQSRPCYEVKTETIKCQTKERTTGFAVKGRRSICPDQLYQEKQYCFSFIFPWACLQKHALSQHQSKVSDCIREPDFLNLINISPLWTVVG